MKKVILFAAGFSIPFIMAIMTPGIAALYIVMAQKSLLIPWLVFVVISIWTILIIILRRVKKDAVKKKTFDRNQLNAFFYGLSASFAVILATLIISMNSSGVSIIDLLEP